MVKDGGSESIGEEAGVLEMHRGLKHAVNRTRKNMQNTREEADSGGMMGRPGTGRLLIAVRAHGNSRIKFTPDMLLY